MPRPQRMYMAGYSYHVVQRGNNRQPCFAEVHDRIVYLDFLLDAMLRYGVFLHAYTLMGNHVHFLMSPTCSDGISRVLGLVGNRYVQYYNWRYRRSGTLWEGRHHACLINSERYLMRCYRYIDLNPVRARLVSRPEAWYWSSYRFNAMGEHNELLTPHELYLSLDRDEVARQRTYRALCKTGLEKSDLEEIRTATRRGDTLGYKAGRSLESIVAEGRVGEPRTPVFH